MEAYKRFKKVIFEWESLLLRLMGYDFLTENFRLSALSFFSYGLKMSIMTCEIYTFLCYTSHTRIFAGLFFFVSSQLAVKIYHVRYVEDFQWLIQFAENLYKIHITSESLERLRFFSKFAIFTEYFFKGSLAFYVSTCGIFLAYPLYMYVAKDELVPILHVFIPGIDETTRSGFLIVIAYQFVLFWFATLGVCAFDFIIAIIIINSLILSKLFALEVKQLHIDLQEREPPHVLKYRLRNMLLIHQGMNEYLDYVERVTFKVFFSQVATNAGSSIVALYVVLTMKFFPAYGLAVVLLFQIFVSCLLGSIVEFTNDQVYGACLNLKWNELPHREQQLYKFLIQRCQNPTLLTIGGIAPLNLDTCVTIFSKIYNATMLIYTLVVE